MPMPCSLRYVIERSSESTIDGCESEAPQEQALPCKKHIDNTIVMNDISAEFCRPLLLLLMAGAGGDECVGMCSKTDVCRILAGVGIDAEQAVRFECPRG